MNLVKREKGALPSIEKAAAIIAASRSTHEILSIRFLAQAVATKERGKEIALDAGELVCSADDRIGALRKEQEPAPKLPMGRGPGRGKKKNYSRTQGVVLGKKKFDEDGLIFDNEFDARAWCLEKVSEAT
jgi:hypothetical protein